MGELSRKLENFSNTEFCLKHIKAHGVNAPDNEVLAVLDADKVMKSYNSLGGTGPASVGHILDTYRDELAKHRHALAIEVAP